MIEFTRVWLPYIYLYGFGGIFFITGLWIVMKNRSMKLTLKKHRTWLGILLFGFFWYAMMHVVVILAAIYG